LITKDICNALNLLDISVIDHMIVGDSKVTSFAELGLI
jgi:DNA repair protein RadC